MTEDQEDDPADRRKPWRRWLRLAAALPAVPLAGLAGLLLVLQVDAVSTAAARGLARVVSSDSLRVRVGTATGSWFGGLDLREVRVEGGSAWAVSVDSASVGYRLIPLLRRIVSLSRVHVTGLEVRATFTTGSGEAAPEARSADRASWTVEVGRIDVDARRVEIVRGTGGEAPPAGPIPDDAWALSEGRLRAHDVVLGERRSATLDTLVASFRPPRREAGWGRLAARGALQGSRVQVDTLWLRSPESQLDVRGVVPLTLGGVAPDDLDLEVSLTPLHLADIGPFLPPPLADSLRVEVHGSARTENDSLRIRLQARSSVPGAVAAEAVVSGSRERPETRGSVEVQALDLQPWGITAQPLVVDGSIEIGVVGATPEALHGRAEADLSLNQGSGNRQGHVRLDAEAESAGAPWSAVWSLDGLGVDARGRGQVRGVPGASWSTTGTLRYERPLRSSAPRDTSASAPSVVLAALAAGFDARGRGFDPDSLLGHLELSLDSAATLGGAPLGPGAITAGVDRGRATLDARLGAGGGRVTVEGSGNVVRRTVDRVTLRVEAVDVAALVGDTLSSRVSGELTGQLTSLAPLSATAEARLSGAEYGPWVVASARGSATVEGANVRTRWAAVLPDSGQLGFQGRLSRDDSGVALELDSLAWRRLDLRALVGATDTTAIPTTNLVGRGRATARRSGGRWTARGDLDLAGSRVGAAHLQEGRIVWSLAAEALTTELRLATEGGGLSGEVRMRGSGPSRRIEVPRLHFMGLDPLGWRSPEDPEIELTGTLDGEISGAGVDSARARVRVDLRGSRVGPAAVDTATLQVSLDAGEVRSDLTARGLGGALRVTVGAELDPDRPRYALEGRLDRPGSGTREDPALFARFGLRGEGRDPDSLTAQGWVEVDSARWVGRLVEEGEARMALQDGVGRIDTLDLKLPGLEIVGDGRLPLRAGTGGDGAVRVQATLTRADVLEGLMGDGILALGEGDLGVRATGSVEALSLEGSLRASALLVNRIRVQGLELDADARRTGGEGWAEGQLHVVADRVRLPTASVQRFEAEATLESEEELAVSASAVIDGRRSAQLRVRVEDVPAPSAVLLEHFVFQADQDRWELERPSRVRFADGIRVDSLAFGAGEQFLALHGHVAREGPVEFHAALQGFEIASVADLVGFPALRGRVNASLDLTGTAAAPRLRSRATSRLDPWDGPAGQLDVHLTYEPGTAEFEASIELDEGPGLRARGIVPTNASLASPVPELTEGEGLTLTAAADSFPVRWFESFVPTTAARELTGTLDGSIDVQGPADEPEARGELTLSAVGARLPALGVAYRGGRGRLDFDGREIAIASVRLGSGEGELRASGTVTLEAGGSPRYDVDLQADRFRIMQTGAIQVTASGRLDLEGEGRAPRVTGRVEVERANLYLGDLVSSSTVEGVTLSAEDYEELARIFGYRRPSERMDRSPFLETATLDLEVLLGRASWVRQRANPELAVQFSGDMTVRKQPGDSIRLVGSVEAVPERSYVEQFGRRFSIAEGSLTFRGAPSATRVEVRAEYEVPSRENPGEPEVVLVLGVSGTPGALSLELSSSPPLEASDMVAYLVTGRPASESLGGGSGPGREGSLAGTGGALALGRLSGAVEAYAREEVGLDVVEISTEGLEGVTLLAGRYLSPDLYLGIRQPVSLQRSTEDASQRAPTPEIEVELQAVRWLLLNLRAGGRAGVEFYVRSRFSYE